MTLIYLIGLIFYTMDVSSQKVRGIACLLAIWAWHRGVRGHGDAMPLP